MPRRPQDKALDALPTSPETRPAAGFEIAAVSHRLLGREVLSGVTLSIAERRVALIGANGSGKTTFARCLNGLIVPDEGTVAIDGLDTRSQGAEVRRRVGYLFQNADHQIVYPVVDEEIGFGLRNMGRTREETAVAVADILARFDAGHLAERPVHALSGGEKRLVTLLSVLVMQPRHLVLDEPTTGLDHGQKRRLADLVAGLPQSVVMITHDFEQIRNFDRAIAFQGGRVVLDGEPRFVVPRWIEAYS